MIRLRIIEYHFNTLANCAEFHNYGKFLFVKMITAQEEKMSGKMFEKFAIFAVMAALLLGSAVSFAEDQTNASLS